AGQASGPARVLHDTRQPPAVRPGDILVAANAGPLWTPYFPLLGGLVLEEGSLGQHAAATARELGIPAIIQLPDATRRIPDGARVRIDGAAGTITRL
ncbi:MAG: hypothetical protein KC425_18790, partial [Anaerolineales bacterium]|nr:hypothetical protein [Anaerolineales bacterium]